jgi:hypothetical protein
MLFGPLAEAVLLEGAVMALSCWATMGAIADAVGVGFILAVVVVSTNEKSKDSWLS